MKRISIISLLCFLGLGFSNAQDVHFSQFDRAPLMVNPALTGAFNGTIRVIANYKDQWSSVGPYRTAAVGLDGGLFKKKWEKNYLAAGIFISNDGVEKVGLSTTAVNFSVSSVVALNKHHSISGGVQGGFVFTGLDETKQKWGTQYDPSYLGGYNPAALSGEDTDNNYSYGDFSLGVFWNYGKNVSHFSGKKQFRANMGFAVFHLNNPKLEFNRLGEDFLNIKFAIHASSYVGFDGSNFSLVPSAIVWIQGAASEYNVGAKVRYTVKDGSDVRGVRKETALSLGAYYRVGDAVIPYLEIEYANFSVGINYDVNVSSLSAYSFNQGGFEISIKYVNPNPFKPRESKVRFL